MTIPNQLYQLSAGLAAVSDQLRESVVQIQVGERGIGSGIVWQIEKDEQAGAAGANAALIVTNAHVVRAARQDTFEVKLPDGRRVEASLVGSDPTTDLAALRVRSSGLRPAEIGDSAALRVGELVIAVGNPYGRDGAVTLGVVAARAPADENMTLEPAEEEQPTGHRRGRGAQFHGIEVIQADIRLYPGNSGGPLADARGRVVGVNAMVGGGLGFAIPSRIVRQFLEDLKGPDEQAYLGIEVLTVPLGITMRQRAGLEQETAAMITAVVAESPAEAAGLLPGDVLLALDGAPIRDALRLPRLLGSGATSVRSRVATILRGGEPKDVALTPALLRPAA